MDTREIGRGTGDAAVPTAIEQEDGSVRASGQVAVIDDDPVLALYLQAVLRAEGHHATWFGDGESALRVLTAPGAARPVLVLLDLSLPGISGMEVLQALVHAGVLARAQVVMMSASASDGTRAAARAGGASAFLTKPVHLEHIRPWLPRAAAAL